jgi:hypothetical protein
MSSFLIIVVTNCPPWMMMMMMMAVGLLSHAEDHPLEAKEFPRKYKYKQKTNEEKHRGFHSSSSDHLSS